MKFTRNVLHAASSLALLAAMSLLIAPRAKADDGVGPRFGQLYSRAMLEQNLIPREQWRPFSPASERVFWDGLPQSVRAALTKRGEKFLGTAWEALPASLYLDFARNGNRSRYEELYFGRRSRLEDLVLAECAENKGRFTDEIVNGLWLILEESSWTVPAHQGMQIAGVGLPDTQEPVVDLFATETGALLAWTDYLLGPQLNAVSPLIRGRVAREVEDRILSPALAREDFWWMGWGERTKVNNWNPWICSNWITAALLLESDSGRRVDGVWKAMRALDNFISGYHADGGCDEGPSYWGRAGASLFDCLELLFSASGGTINVFSDPLIRNMGRYIYRVHIFDRYFIDFADAPARVTIPSDLVYRYGKRIGDDKMMALGAWAASKKYSYGDIDDASIGRLLPALATYSELDTVKGYQPLVRDSWLDGIQVMAARSRGGSPEGLYLAAKGGNNAESHNHNDVGNFIVYYDGRPALIDAGVGTYTAKTFSDQRYDIWTMQSAYHNLPTINGVMQHEGAEYAARDVQYDVDKGGAELSLDIAAAYPPEAGVKSWKRTLKLDRGKEVRLTDSFELVRHKGDLYLSLLTCCRVDVSKPGVLTLTEARPPEGAEPFTLSVSYDRNRLAARVEEIKIDDRRLLDAWGGDLYRVMLSAPARSPRKDTWELRITK